jgi:hypothetical protein
MEAMCSPETSVNFQQTIRCYIPEDITLHNHRCENLNPKLFVSDTRLILSDYHFWALSGQYNKLSNVTRHEDV